jgi:hypothetical protein
VDGSEFEDSVMRLVGAVRFDTISISVMWMRTAFFDAKVEVASVGCVSDIAFWASEDRRERARVGGDRKETRGCRAYELDDDGAGPTRDYHIERRRF